MEDSDVGAGAQWVQAYGFSWRIVENEAAGDLEPAGGVVWVSSMSAESADALCGESASVDLNSDPSTTGLCSICVLSSEEAFRFRIGMSVFAISLDGSSIRYWNPQGFGACQFHLFGMVAAFVVGLRSDATVMHASAIANGEFAALLVGPNGVGKSTLTKAMCGFGWRPVADGMTALSVADGNLVCPPGFPWIRLWPKSITALGVDSAPSQSILGGGGKRAVFGSAVDSGLPPRVRRVILVGRDRSAEPRARSLAPSVSMAALANERYFWFLRGRLGLKWVERDFSRLGSLVRSQCVSSFTMPDDILRLRECCLILNDVLVGA